MIDPTAMLSHGQTGMDELASVFFQLLQHSGTLGAVWIGTPSSRTLYKNHRAQNPNDGSKMPNGIQNATGEQNAIGDPKCYR